MNELALIEWLRRQKGVAGIGDDCAILRVPAGQELLVTTDQLIEDVHFRHATHTAADCGWKAMARGLSDVAAMGGTPRWAFLSAALGESCDARWWRGFHGGFLALARRYAVTLAGGDLSRAGLTSFDVTVLGLTPQGRSLKRSGARAGNVLYVSGPLGRAAARGWRDRPEPRIEMGRKLRGVATACMDLSDGLALDLHRLCLESGVTAVLDQDVPVFRGATLEQALYGGEDYELMCTLPLRRKAPAGLIRIGRIVEGKPGGPLAPRGWDPFAAGRGVAGLH